MAAISAISGRMSCVPDAAVTDAMSGTKRDSPGGTIAGFGPARMAQMNLQQRYDTFYAQCMYGNGDQMPGLSPAYAAAPRSR